MTHQNTAAWAGTGAPKSYLRQAASALTLAGLLVTGPAFAQEAEQAAPRSTSSGPAPGNVAQESIEDIIVTATKRANSVQDVPIAVTALSADFVERANLTEAADLQRYVPNLTFREDFSASQRNFVIRGVGTGTNSIGVEGSVGIVVDNVVLGREGAGVSGFADIERIEVLRGPQGTLFGKNASAGVVNIVTKRPNLKEFETFVKASYGNYDDVRVNGHVTGPIAPGIGFHLSGFGHRNDGYNRNVLVGTRSGQVEEYGVRLKTLFEVSPALEIQLLADFQESDRLCCEATPRVALPNSLLDVAVIKTGLARLRRGSRDAVQEERAFDDIKQGGVSAEVNWSIGDYTVTSITAYREFQNNLLIVPDLLPNRIQIIAAGESLIDQSQFTQEVRLTSPARDRLNYVIGLFYFDQDSTIDSLRRGFGLNAVSPAGTIITVVPSNPALASAAEAADHTISIAGFADATFRVSEAFNLLFGARYTHEKRSGEFRRFRGPGAPAPHPGFPPVSPPDVDEKDSAFTYRVGAQYRFTPDIQAYATYSTGYKGIGIDLNPNLGTTVSVVKPETVKNFEVGIKSDFFANRLQVNVAAFSSRFKNYQGTAFDPSSVSFNLQSVKGLGADGLEIEVIAIPVRGLRLNANASYIDARWTSFTNAGCYPGQTVAQGCVGGIQDLTGERPPRAPEYTYTIGFDYEAPITEALGGFVNLSWSWRDDTQYSIDNVPAAVQPAYGLLDGAIGVRTEDGRYQLSVFGKNILDKEYSGYITGLVGQTGNYSQIPGAPAVYGVQVSARF